MTYVVLMLLLALTGAAEEAPVPDGEVVTETCDATSTEPCDAATPSELPGPRPL